MCACASIVHLVKENITKPTAANHRGMCLLSVTAKILPHVLVAGLTDPLADITATGTS